MNTLSAKMPIGNGYFVTECGFVIGNTGVFLRTTINKQGYHRVDINIDGVKKKRLVHRLVASAFVENEHNKPCVNHIDGNPSNNAAINLEWVTQSENQIHAYRTGLQKGHKVPVPMTPQLRIAIKEGFYRFHRFTYHVGEQAFGRIAEVADAFAIDRSTASRRFSSNNWPTWRRENNHA